MRLVCGAYSEPATTKRWLRKLSENKQLKIESNYRKESSQKETNNTRKLVQVLNKKVKCVRGKGLPSPSLNYATKKHRQSKLKESKLL